MGRLQEEAMPKVRMGLRTRQAGEAVGGRRSLAAERQARGREATVTGALKAESMD